MKQGHLLDDLCGEVAMPTTPTGFAGVDGRTGQAVDRINLALIEMLRKDSVNDAAKLNDKGGVSREHYASRLNIHYTYLVKCCAATLSNWDAYFEARRGELKPIARAFVDAVKADLVSGKSLAIVGNNIRISTYAERLGFSRGAIVKSLGPNLYRLKAELADLGVFSAQPVNTRRTRTAERNKKAAIDAQFCEKQAAALQILLIEDDTGAALHLTDRFQVDQTHYAAALDIKKLCPRALEVIKQWNQSLKKRHEGLSPVGKKFLAAIEVDRASADGVAASEQRNIDLHYYAKKLGVSVGGIRYSLGEKLFTISNSLRGEGALRTDLEKRLLAIIDAELAEGKKPVIGRGGKLDYPHYARLLNVKPYRLHSSIVVDELNSKYGSTSKVEARLYEMRLWLEKHYEQKTLRIRNGQLDRKQFQDAFNLKGGTYLVRYERIKALFDEFDERILAENYRPAQLDNDLHRLIDLLRTDPELNRNQLTVNRTRLAKRLRIPLHVLKEGAFDQEWPSPGKVVHFES